MRVGIFGGTFDPPHTGHLIVAQDAALALRLDRILFIPAAQPPHKQGLAISPAPVRAEMLALAIADDDRFSVDAIELERTGASYTVHTLEALHQREPGTEWTLLIGADQYRELHTWREPGLIQRLARLAVLTRDGSGGPVAAGGAVPAVRELENGAVEVDVTRVDVSSTLVRARVAAGLPIRYMVPDRVERFIFRQRLYGGNGAGTSGYDAGHTDIRG